ncbi:glycosyltransferase family 2 protein [Clostridium sp. D2Q-14]|uniref:glycosyltransferase family 2 protein n=1 Tax=Anaeromonas gelatinilytica TaxID=2683194 RepID=UPI00193B97E3|nr:glycosyltransferase family 2 protein [Anaeromonas gelatinilytica]MBS4536013.1 glycosyltransferase family 2 protein [Anaeromonas gelatinilytica]
MYHITAIIPALNEEKTIENIIETVKKVDLIDNIIVISDGSTDDTAYIAKKTGVNVIEFNMNKGKGAAVKSGFEYSETDIVLFLDADLLGLTPKHITNLILPIISDEYSMTIGIFTKGRFKTDFAQKITPFLSGQRAIRGDLFKKIPNIDISKYGLEMTITKYFINNDIKFKEIPLNNLTHLVKEEKMGVLNGFKERFRMYLDISKFLIRS